jgi:hydrogenase expression/formation protein HypC
MCLAIPGQIERILPGTALATADVSGIKRNINIGLLEQEGIAPGDWVLIHVGFAISKVDEQEARASLEFLHSLGQAFTDEIAALEQSGGAGDAPAPETHPPPGGPN